MNNNDKTIVCIGRIKTIEKLEENKTKISLKVLSAFFDNADEYDNKLIDCILTNELSNAINKYCIIDDIIGIRGKADNTQDTINIEKLTCIERKNI